MGERAGRRRRAAQVAVLAVIVLDVLLLLTGVVDTGSQEGFVVGLSAPLVAAGAAWWRAVRSTGRHRLAWVALALAFTCPTLGAAGWAAFDAVGRYGSVWVADAALLAFGVFACVGLVLRPTMSPGRRLLTLLDAVAAAGALLLISWLTVLEDALRVAAGRPVEEVAYYLLSPTLDVAVLALVLLTLARTPPSRSQLPLVVLAAGLALLAVADSLYLHVVVTAGEQPDGPVRALWSIGCGLLALAAIADDQPAEQAVATRPLLRPRVRAASGLLPYLPVGGAVIAVTAASVGRGGAGPIAHLVVLTLVGLLFVRQYLSLTHNARLAARVAEREAELHHLAFHDPLTGLVNRAGFHERLTRALARHASDRTPLGLLFIDLDGFKVVNDTLGHATGDRLLVAVADRLRAATRAADTVARLGGDEFAVLLEPGFDPHHCAARIAALMADPVPIGSERVRTGGSTGVVELTADDPTPTEDDLLTRADLAMYAVKYAARATVRERRSAVAE